MTDTVLVIGPPLAGASAVAAALRGRLAGCVIVEPPGLAPGQLPDAVVFVTSAAAPMSACDAALLAVVAARTAAVVAAVTKIDVHRTWRAVLEVNRTALRDVSRDRDVPWVGVAADPEAGPMVVGPLVDAVRVELDDDERRHRNLVRAGQWAAQRRVAEQQRETARRAGLRARAARRSAERVRVQQARIHLSGRARAQCAALRCELQRDAAEVSRRGLDSFAARVHRRAQQVADDFDGALAQRMAAISTTAATVTSALPPSSPVQSYLPTPRRADLEDRLAAVFGTGFGLGVTLTVGRFLAEVLPAATVAVVALSCVAGVALAGWVVRTRRLVTVRGAMDRWTAEVAAALRTALEERLSAAESVLVTACLDADAAASHPYRRERRGNPVRGQPELSRNPD